MANEIEYKIAVIFAKDIVDYSKHTEVDKSETAQDIRAYKKTITRVFKQHGGDIFNQ